MVADLTALHHLIEVILHNGISQAGNQVVLGYALLLIIIKLRLHKDRAPFAQRARAVRTECPLGELLVNLYG